MATNEAGCIFISNINSGGTFLIKNNSFDSNWINYNGKNEYGSMIFLQDPGNISITDSQFLNNTGITGTCISYSESKKNYSVVITKTIFQNNKALLGSAVFYFATNNQLININSNNQFINNVGLYRDFLSSPPFRLRLSNFLKINCLQFNKKKNQYSLLIEPGITNFSLDFEVLDYYQNQIASLKGSYSLPFLKNAKTFSNIIDPSISFAAGTSSSTVIMGNSSLFIKL